MELAWISARHRASEFRSEFHPYSTTGGEDDQARVEAEGKTIVPVVKVSGKFGDAGRVGIVVRIHGAADDARIVTCSGERRAYGLSEGGVRPRNPAARPHRATSPHCPSSLATPPRSKAPALADVQTYDQPRRQHPREKRGNRRNSGEVGVLPLRRIRPEIGREQMASTASSNGTMQAVARVSRCTDVVVRPGPR